MLRLLIKTGVEMRRAGLCGKPWKNRRWYWLLGVWGYAVLVLALTSYVVPPGQESGTPASPYHTWTNAATNIQHALDVYNANPAYNTILISGGVYTLATTLIVTNPLTIRSYRDGMVDRDGTIINGNSTRCFYVNHTGAVIEGLTITNGVAASSAFDGHGGGMYIAAVSMITNCRFIGNFATNEGGGLYASNAVTLVANCIFNGNTATNGGGASFYLRTNRVFNCQFYQNTAGRFGGGINQYGGYLEISGCHFISNQCLAQSDMYGGAGLLINSGLLRMSNSLFYTNISNSGGGGAFIRYGNGHMVQGCYFSNNVALYVSYYGSGGGVCVYRSGDTTISDCRFIGNWARFGGGVLLTAASGARIIDRCFIASNFAYYAGGGVSLYNEAGYGHYPSNIVRNSLIIGNTAYDQGGGGVSIQTNGRVENCTIVGNAATRASSSSRGGGLYAKAACLGWAVNTIIYSNQAALAGSENWIVADGPGAFAISNCCATPSAAAYGAGNIEADPQLANWLSGDYHLSAGSPCVDRGLRMEWMLGQNAWDLDGQPRCFGFGRWPDIGAYERRYPGMMIQLH